jgi:hypothetical protein
MTQYKPYPKYKNSNIPCLEEILPLSEQIQIVS